jgi:hypothetical protein
MPTNDNLDRFSKILGLIGDLGKLAVTTAAALFMVGALAAPGWVRDRLEALDLRIDKINLLIVTLVRDQVPKANANAYQATEYLTRLEVEVAAKMPADQAAPLLKNIREAKDALDDQNRSIAAVAGAAGFERQLPATAWVYVGFFSEGGGAGKLGDRLDPARLAYDGGSLRSLVLKYDAPVSSNGDNCTRTDIADVAPIDPKALGNKLLIVKGSSDPVQVLRTTECPSVGRGKTVFAEIRVPGNRVRVAELAAISR